MYGTNWSKRQFVVEEDVIDETFEVNTDTDREVTGYLQEHGFYEESYYE